MFDEKEQERIAKTHGFNSFKALLHTWYVRDKKPCSTIAILLNVSGPTAKSILGMYGFSPKSRSEVNAGVRNSKVLSLNKKLGVYVEVGDICDEYQIVRKIITQMLKGNAKYMLIEVSYKNIGTGKIYSLIAYKGFPEMEDL